MRTRLGGLAACLLVVGLAVPARAADASVDRKINNSLRDVINRGKVFYDGGDPAACYYLFGGALMTVRPLLDDRPELQKAIDRGLADAARHADMRRRAWALRHVLDHVRASLKGNGWTPPVPGEVMPPAGGTLWSRLGGEAKVRQVVDDFVAIAAPDPAVNFDRDGKYKFTEDQIDGLKKSLVALISQVTGGPIKYTGKSMKEVHKGMGITDAEFNAAGADLVKALEKNGVAPADIKALMKIVGSTRPDIVEPRKAEPKDDEMPKEKEKIKKPKDDDEKKDDEKPKEKAKDKDDEKAKDKDKDDDKPKEKAKDKDDEKAKDKDDDKPKEKAKDKDDEKAKDDEKPKEKAKDKDDDK